MDGLLFLGLDYAGVKVALDMANITLTKSEWRGFQIMETEARNIMNEK